MKFWYGRLTNHVAKIDLRLIKMMKFSLYLLLTRSLILHFKISRLIFYFKTDVTALFKIIFFSKTAFTFVVPHTHRSEPHTRWELNYAHFYTLPLFLPLYSVRFVSIVVDWYLQNRDPATISGVVVLLKVRVWCGTELFLSHAPFLAVLTNALVPSLILLFVLVKCEFVCVKRCGMHEVMISFNF